MVYRVRPRILEIHRHIYATEGRSKPDDNDEEATLDGTPPPTLGTMGRTP